MKKIGFLALLLVMLTVFLAPAAHAVGFGFYGSTGTGSADWNEDYFITQKSADTERKAFGITLDTGLSGSRFFNYHLNIGREALTSKKFFPQDGSGTPAAAAAGDLELEGLVMSHTFGFGAEMSDSVRMWLGPEIRWHWVKGTPATAPAFDIDGAGFGFGPSLAFNFNFPTGLTLMVKAGYIMANYSLNGDGYIGGSYASNSYDVDDTFTYINFEFLFRSRGDR